MIINKHADWINEDSYNIYIEQDDDVNEFDLAESFKEQYPKVKCVISFSRVIQLEFGFIVLGLNNWGKK